MSSTTTAADPARPVSRGGRPGLAVGLGLLAVFTALAVAVAAGWPTRLDQWAIDRTMPWEGGTGGPPSGLLGTAFPIFHHHASDSSLWGPLAVYVVTWPASAGTATAIVLVCLVLLWRRQRRREAVAWGAAWVVANLAEVITKTALTRPPLYVHGRGAALHIFAFDNAFPSGHTVRSIMLAAIVGTLLPRLRPWLYGWAALVCVLLDVGSWHVPSDIAGGIALAVGTILVVQAYAPAARSATASPGS